MLRNAFQAALGRGRVDLAVFIRRESGEDEGGVDVETLRSTLRVLRRIIDEAHESSLEVNMPNALELLRFASSSKSGGNEVPSEPPPFLAELAGEALDQLLAFRAREGEALTGVLSGFVNELLDQVAALRSEVATDRPRIQARLLDRLASLCQEAEIDSPDVSRVTQEVAMVLTRGDVEEEFDRIDSHVGQMRSTLGADPHKGQGKTLDFLTQELLREVTTIGSKITSHRGSHLVIAAKGTIERIREQVQNVE